MAAWASLRLSNTAIKACCMMIPSNVEHSAAEPLN
jgi:hypothetical protein